MEAIQLNFLGGYSARGDLAGPVNALGKKASALLAILAVSPGNSASRERISDLLWSATGDELARSSLRQTISLIRRAFRDVCDDLLDTSGRSEIALKPSLFTCDVVMFREHLAAGRQSEAIALYAGPFLDGMFIRDSAFEDWSATERRALRDHFVEAIEVLTRQAFGREKVALARRWVGADPYHEPAHRILIESLAETGARDEASRQFRALQDLFRSDLGADVSSETADLLRDIEKPRPGIAPSTVNPEAKAPASQILAIHPLVCLSEDRETLMFGSSLVSSLVTTLSKLPYLRVAAMGTVGRSSKHSDDLGAVDRASAADYTLEGVLMAADGRVRLNIHLVDRRAGEYVFSHRHDADPVNWFQAQDEITLKIAVAINVSLLQGDQALSKLNKANQLEPWELVLQASTLVSSHDRICFPAALRCINEAIRMDPGYAAAHTLLGWWHWGQAFCGWSNDPDASVAAALAAAAHGRELDPENPEPHVVMAIAQMQKRDFAAADACLAVAMRLGRNHAMVYAVAANVASFAGRPQAAIPLAEQAMRLCPVYPPWYAGDLAQAHLQLGQFAQALVWSKAAIDRSAGYIHAHLFQTIALHELGRHDEALEAARMVMKLDPAFGVRAWVRGQPFLDPTVNEHFLTVLVQAGLPQQL